MHKLKLIVARTPEELAGALTLSGVAAQDNLAFFIIDLSSSRWQRRVALVCPKPSRGCREQQQTRETKPRQTPRGNKFTPDHCPPRVLELLAFCLVLNSLRVFSGRKCRSFLQQPVAKITSCGNIQAL